MTKSYSIEISIIELDNFSFHIITEAYINGLKVNLVIDTGASMSVFDSNFFKDHVSKSAEKQEKIMSAGITASKINAVRSYAENFKIGLLEINKFPMILIDMKRINTVYRKATGKEIHGLIGSDFLVSMKAVIDFDKQLLLLKSESI